MKYPLIIGNWKLNGNSQMVKTFIQKISNTLKNVIFCKIVIAPPILYLTEAKKKLNNSKIELCAQNVDINLSGSFTGEISAKMLKDIGTKYIIIGHSERRKYHKENNFYIVKKFSIAKSQGLIPVLCIGENKKEYNSGKTQEVCAYQIDQILNVLGVNAFENSVIAYEPIWAIGTGKAATPEHAQKVHQFIRQHIGKKNLAIAKQIIIQYGGSVNENNARDFFMQSDIDGALIGKSSLKSDIFSTIVNIAASTKFSAIKTTINK
ncbi:triose-phosphate isomerase [Arsenophonus symbiont of Ornithomya chloropus]|uniref:triose-phosphate isomerase n=1 Tax=Arsenophonus symbiont of Ornithomya chloropus TaxID=634121 RepID=UPI0032B23045